MTPVTESSVAQSAIGAPGYSDGFFRFRALVCGPKWPRKHIALLFCPFLEERVPTVRGRNRSGKWASDSHRVALLDGVTSPSSLSACDNSIADSFERSSAPDRRAKARPIARYASLVVMNTSPSITCAEREGRH